VAYSQLCDFYSFFGKVGGGVFWLLLAICDALAQVTHVYRHNAAMRQLLLDGVIWGFLSKEEAVQHLSELQPGSFLVRVSDVQPGTFSVSWKDPQCLSIRHARLDAKLISQPITAIADYFASKPFLLYVYSPFTRLGSQTVQRPSLRTKDEVLSRFSGMPRKTAAAVSAQPMMRDGYEDIEMVL
jgi:hypothetical protein